MLEYGCSIRETGDVVNSTIARVQILGVIYMEKTNSGLKGAETSMPQRSLGATIRTAREAHGLGRADFARLLGVPPSQITRWETNEVTPSPQSLVTLANQLEVRASDLFMLAGVPVPTDLASLPAMLRAEYHLPPEAITEIQAHIEQVAAEYRNRRADT
jgi:transcriptional regulator with XRE-family HTH domain